MKTFLMAIRWLSYFLENYIECSYDEKFIKSNEKVGVKK